MVRQKVELPLRVTTLIVQLERTSWRVVTSSKLFSSMRLESIMSLSILSTCTAEISGIWEGELELLAKMLMT
jgi:hypothetical protein